MLEALSQEKDQPYRLVRQSRVHERQQLEIKGLFGNNVIQLITFYTRGIAKKNTHTSTRIEFGTMGRECGRKSQAAKNTEKRVINR